MIQSIQTIIIGSDIPDIAINCIAQNSTLCYNSRVPFRVNHYDRDYNFKTVGIQADHIKLEIQSENIGILLVDFDLQLVTIPELPVSPFPYMGKNNRQPDSFISHVNTPEASNEIKKLLTLNRKKPSYNANILNKINTVSIPDSCYIHYCTRLGFSVNGYTGFTDVNKKNFNERYRHVKHIT